MTCNVGLVEIQNEAKVEGKSKRFQLFFLNDDNHLHVEVVETRKIDVEELIGCLNRGESVFIKKVL